MERRCRSEALLGEQAFGGEVIVVIILHADELIGRSAYQDLRNAQGILSNRGLIGNRQIQKNFILCLGIASNDIITVILSVNRVSHRIFPLSFILTARNNDGIHNPFVKKLVNVQIILSPVLLGKSF